MDVLEYIITLIKEVGFPIACCVALFVMNNKLINTLVEIKETMKTMSGRIDEIETRMNKRRSNDVKKEK